jgi:hypothetical protein
MPEIFISYAREDQTQAERLYRDLKKEGFDAWIDTQDLLAGSNWSAEIRRAIRASQYFVLLLSAKSMTKRGFVHREIREALEVVHEMPETEIFLIPARLESCEVTHEDLGRLHWVDLFPDWDNGLAQITKSLRRRSFEDGRATVDQQRNLGAASRLSENELRVAEYILKDPQEGVARKVYNMEDLSAALSLDIKDVKHAVAELVSRMYLERLAVRGTDAPPVMATPFLFWDLDPYVHGWDPREDAKTIARALVETSDSGHGRLQTRAFAERHGWPLRRLNPALDYLVASSIVNSSQISVPDVVTLSIFETEVTRAFLRGDFDPDSRRRSGR